MNPHAMAKRHGAHLVAEEFCAEDPLALSDNHPPRAPRSPVGTTAKPSRSR
ncbi:hypothetical protein [Streptomyces ossamyceticus]|jgi:hypothetical protein|uniref:hypothetical protein n=1 Tax=Streptomyces ossamyceticus TaxID=249581 RepID=UPI00343FBF64